MNKILKTNKDKVQFEKWIKALRSGKYKQTTGTLQDDQGYCCLGVACKVVVKRKDLKLRYGILIGVFPSRQLSPLWLGNVNFKIANLFGTSLSVLNDDHNYSFNDIADILSFFYENDML